CGPPKAPSSGQELVQKRELCCHNLVILLANYPAWLNLADRSWTEGAMIFAPDARPHVEREGAPLNWRPSADTVAGGTTCSKALSSSSSPLAARPSTSSRAAV